MDLNRILFTGDSFRTTEWLEPAQLRNASWLQEQFAPVLRSTTKLDSRLAFPLWGTLSDWVRLQQDPGYAAWAAAFWSEPTPELIDAVSRGTEGSLVVGIELSPVMVAALDAAGTPWVEINISPLRFLADFAIHIRTSGHFDISSVSQDTLSEDDIQEAIQRVKAWATPQEPGRVFFAQTPTDRTVITDGRFASEHDALAAFDPAGLRVKRHPWVKECPIVDALVYGGAVETEADTYALLCTDGVEVETLSSSVGREAKAFGRPTTIAIPEVQDWSNSGVDVMQKAFASSLWARLLSSGGIGVSQQPDLPWEPNRLRAQIGGFGLHPDVWGAA